MKVRHIASIAITGAAAAAIAAAPIAAASPVTDPAPAGATITQRDGHVHIDATPDKVSEPRSYGQWSSPAPFLFWD
jgi:hypothetical protein